MNKVIIMGRLTRDPDIRYTQGDQPHQVARYTLAVDRRGRGRNNGENTADFINCVAFDRGAEFASKYLTKGMRILVTGRIQTGSYTNKDGQKVYTVDVVAEDQEFTESRRDNGATAGTNQQQPYYANANQQPDYSGNAVYEDQGSYNYDSGFMQMPDDGYDEGLPFN